MNNNLSDLFDQMNNNLSDLFDQMNNRFDQIDNSFDRVNARLVNDMLTEPTDPISPLLDKEGNNPPGFFPATLEELENLTNTQVQQLLQFYRLPKAPLATRHKRLRNFLGIK